MTTERALAEWRDAGLIDADQYARLTALVRKDRFPVFLELNTLLYLGVIAFAAGLAWTIREHFASLGDAAILSALGAIFIASLTYCFARTGPYTNRQVDSPTFAFDYVLYLGCLAFAAGVGYVEYRFHLLRENWDAYLLASAVLYFALAYRFDNRFVLSLGLSTLAGWFGVRLTAWHVLPEAIRGLAIVYGALVVAAGTAGHRLAVKAHFLDAYLHVGVNAMLLALTSGAMEREAPWWWMAGLLGAAAGSVTFGVRLRSFAFVVYGVVYAYVGLSAQVGHLALGDTGMLWYFVLSALMVVASLVVMAQRFGRAE